MWEKQHWKLIRKNIDQKMINRDHQTIKRGRSKYHLLPCTNYTILSHYVLIIFICNLIVFNQCTLSVVQ